MKIALDVDDVLANWYKAACEFCGVEYIERNHWCEKESGNFIFPEWENIQADENFWHKLEVLNTVDFDFDFYITSLPPHLYENRLNWLKKHGFPNKPLHLANDKVSKAKELGVDVIIDDKPSTVEAFIEAGLTAIHYIPPYSTIEPISPYYTYDFGEIKNMLNLIENKHYGEKSRGVQNVQTRK